MSDHLAEARRALLRYAETGDRDLRTWNNVLENLIADLETAQAEVAKRDRALRIAISEAREFADAEEIEHYAQSALWAAAQVAQKEADGR